MNRLFQRRLLSSRPDLKSIIPGKRTFNRLLFDFDSRLLYKKVIPVLTHIYDHLDEPEQIRLSRKIKGSDLMIQKHILATLRIKTNTTNRNLVDLENELVEQAAELGDNDAITILAFESLNSAETSAEDFKYAQGLVNQLVEKKHPLVFKMAGDLAFQRSQYPSAAQYWQEFLELENDTVMASQVHSNLGVYYFSYFKPVPDLGLAKLHFEKLIKIGELDKYTVIAHYYLGQLYATTHPELARYHLEVAASQGLKESFATLGFLELNTFNKYEKAVEWFQLGDELNSDLTCLVGIFDCRVNLKQYQKAQKVLDKLEGISELIKKVKLKNLKPKTPELENSLKTNEMILNVFFDTRAKSIEEVEQNS